MKKRSFIYEEIIDYLLKNKMVNENFKCSDINIPSRGKTISSFLYKHSNPKNKDIWTLFFKRPPKAKFIIFCLDMKVLKDYESSFRMKLIKK